MRLYQQFCGYNIFISGSSVGPRTKVGPISVIVYIVKYSTFGELMILLLSIEKLPFELQ
jgi:hypothetical protein